MASLTAMERKCAELRTKISQDVKEFNMLDRGLVSVALRHKMMHEIITEHSFIFDSTEYEKEADFWYEQKDIGGKDETQL